MTLAEFRPIYQGMLMGNCGHTKESAEKIISEGQADVIAFGRPFITNPDLPERFKNSWPINPAEDMSRWYTPGPPEGYIDYEPFRPT
jgi:N-ethylmaleimide reductase